ncbi:MAG: hypothetical protein IJB71_03340 [Bacilli bacterium]|nr:hypothetical protein [Bacilli bacterium]
MKNRIVYEKDTINVYLSGKYSSKKFNALKQKINLIRNSYGIDNVSFICDHDFNYQRILDK